MAQVVYKSNALSGNYTKRIGGSVTFSGFSLYSGSAPPAGSSVTSVDLIFSKVSTWGSRSLDCTYGSIDFSSGLNGSTLNETMYDVSSSIINFSGGSVTFIVSGSASSSDIISFRDGCTCSIVINYSSSSASTGDLSSTSVAQGGQISLNINSADDSFTHKVSWEDSIGATITHSIAEGVYYDSITVPTSWALGTAKVTLETYFGSERVGSARSYTFTVTVDPSTITPTPGTLSVALVQSPYVPSDWGNVYVQGYSRCKLTLTGSSPGAGLSYQSIDLKVGSQSQSTSDKTEFTSNVIREYGTVTCSASVTNSNGIKRTADSKTITVNAYNAPVINTCTAFRCSSNGEPTDKGQYIGIRVIVTVSSISGKNGLQSLKAQYAEKGSTTWSSAVAVSNNGTTVISGVLDIGKKYQVKLIAVDKIQNLEGSSTTQTVEALTTSHVIYCADGGINVCFGCEDSTTQNAVIISKDWKLYHGTTELTGTVPIERGGTGATSLKTARKNLGLGDSENVLPIANGGTGADSVKIARKNLGLGETDGAVPVANGGTGATSATAARTNLGITLSNLGAAPATHSHSASDISSGTLAKARLPYKFAYGSKTVSGVSWSTVDISSAGFTQTPGICCTVGGGASAINGSYDLSVKTRNEGTDSFDVCIVGSSGSGSRTIRYICVGV